MESIEGGRLLVIRAEGKRPFPFRTRKLSPPAPMVLPWQRGGRVGHCQRAFLPFFVFLSNFVRVGYSWVSYFN